MFVGVFQDKDSGVLVDAFLTSMDNVYMCTTNKELKFKFDKEKGSLTEQIEDKLAELVTSKAKRGFARSPK